MNVDQIWPWKNLMRTVNVLFTFHPNVLPI